MRRTKLFLSTLSSKFHQNRQTEDLTPRSRQTSKENKEKKRLEQKEPRQKRYENIEPNKLNTNIFTVGDLNSISMPDIDIH